MADCGTLEVVAPEPNIQVSCTNPSPTTLDPGETVTITGTIANTGNADGQVTYEWLLNGNRLGTTATVTVQAGGDVAVETNAPYDRVVQVAGTGSINVELNPISVQRASAPRQSQPVKNGSSNSYSSLFDRGIMKQRTNGCSTC